jgi:hypothetical protein
VERGCTEYWAGDEGSVGRFAVQDSLQGSQRWSWVNCRRRSGGRGGEERTSDGAARDEKRGEGMGAEKAGR